MVISDEVQLGQALGAFGKARFGEEEGPSWAKRMRANLNAAGIASMNDLQQGCREDTVNLDLELFGIPIEERFSDQTLQQLGAFLPGPIGNRCFRLAQKCAEKVKDGSANVKYVHRPESGKIGKEHWAVPVGDDWKLHVDCAGFVRNVLKHVTKDPWQLSMSDRDFMRAKDFFRFFQAIPYSIMDDREHPEVKQKMQWRRIDDLRLVIPGDVIVYRPKGNAAGAAAFTTNDRSDLKHMLKAVKTAALWHEEEGEWKNLVTRNVAKDPRVKPWVEEAKAMLERMGVKTVKDFRDNFAEIKNKLNKTCQDLISDGILELMMECATTTAMNTGHIVFASGPAVLKGEDEYRIRVIHSTKNGPTDEEGNPTEGVQEYYRRFTLVRQPGGGSSWTREVLRAPLDDDEDEDDNPFDDMSDDDDEDSPEDSVDTGDELEGQTDVEVIGARMCF